MAPAARASIGDIFVKMMQLMKNSIGWRSPLSQQDAVSSAKRRYTPAETGTCTSSQDTGQDSAQTIPTKPMSAQNSGPARPLSLGSNTSSSSSQSNIECIIFGIQNTRELVELESIKVSDSLDDESSFSELRKRYNQHCWFLQRLLSPFRFQHCKFVQVKASKTNNDFITLTIVV